MNDENSIDIESEVPEIPYEPFPAFEEWAKAAPNFAMLDLYAGKIPALRDDSQYAGIEVPTNLATSWAVIDTGAIEGLYEVDRGFTYSVALQSTKWEDLPKIKGARAALYIQDALNAYDWLLDCVTGQVQISENWIKELHSIMCASQESYTVYTDLGTQDQALVKGQYKIFPNNPVNPNSTTVHNYCPPNDVIPEMQRLIDELRSEKFTHSHPLLQISYSHYAFVSIHPFADGNGRVARALASIYSYKHYQIPLVIFADQKMDYFNSLEKSDNGAFEEFTSYAADRVIDAIGMVLAEFYRLARPSIESLQQGMQRNLLSRGGFPFALIDSIGLRILDEFSKDFKDEVGKHALMSEFKIQYPTGYSQQVNFGIPGFRNIAGTHPIFYVQMSGEPPVGANISRNYDVCVAQVDHVGTDFIVTRDGSLLCEVFLREVHPVILESFKQKIKLFATGEFSDLVADATNMASQNLRAQGYS